MFPNFLGFILLVCYKAHLDLPKTVEKPSVAICFVKNRIIPVLLPQYRVPVPTSRDVSSSETESDDLASGRVSFVAGRRIESWEQ